MRTVKKTIVKRALPNSLNLLRLTKRGFLLAAARKESLWNICSPLGVSTLEGSHSTQDLSAPAFYG